MSELSKYHEIHTFSILFAEPGFMADTLLIPALPSFRSHWLFPLSVLSSSPNCWSRSWASQHLAQPLTPRLLMISSKAICMTCIIHGMWFIKAGPGMAEDLSFDCCSRVIEEFEEALSVVIPSKRLSVSSNQSTTSFTCTASLAPMCWPLTYHP